MTNDEVNEKIEEWHNQRVSLHAIHEHLGWTRKEYLEWLENKTIPDKKQSSPNWIKKKAEQEDQYESISAGSYFTETTELDDLFLFMKNLRIWPYGENSADKVLFRAVGGNWVYRDPSTQTRVTIDHDHALHIAKGVALDYIKSKFDGKAYIDNDGNYILGECTSKYAGRTPTIFSALDIASKMKG